MKKPRVINSGLICSWRWLKSRCCRPHKTRLKGFDVPDSSALSSCTSSPAQFAFAPSIHKMYYFNFAKSTYLGNIS